MLFNKLLTTSHIFKAIVRKIIFDNITVFFRWWHHTLLPAFFDTTTNVDSVHWLSHSYYSLQGRIWRYFKLLVLVLQEYRLFKPLLLFLLRQTVCSRHIDPELRYWSGICNTKTVKSQLTHSVVVIIASFVQLSKIHSVWFVTVYYINTYIKFLFVLFIIFQLFFPNSKFLPYKLVSFVWYLNSSEAAKTNDYSIT